MTTPRSRQALTASTSGPELSLSSQRRFFAILGWPLHCWLIAWPSVLHVSGNAPPAFNPFLKTSLRTGQAGLGALDLVSGVAGPLGSLLVRRDATFSLALSVVFPSLIRSACLCSAHCFRIPCSSIRLSLFGALLPHPVLVTHFSYWLMRPSLLHRYRHCLVVRSPSTIRHLTAHLALSLRSPPQSARSNSPATGPCS